MGDPGILYIERTDCGNCFRCVRECAVKAIHFHGPAARIDADKCVLCGACLAKCNDQSVKMRDDVHLARKFIKNHNIKVASVSPEWMAEFEGVEEERFVEALQLLGFTHVSESSLGAQATLLEEARLMTLRKGIGISPRCPAVVDYINKYRPKLAPALLDVDYPAVAHARMIREWWGPEARIVHISSCAAAKAVADDNSDLIDIALTFRELKRWMRNESILLEKIPGNAGYGFEPFRAQSAIGYSLTGWGAQREHRCLLEANDVYSVTVSSLEALDATLALPPSISGTPVYLDLMACPGGCIGSKTVTISKSSAIDLRILFEKRAADRSKSEDTYELPKVELARPVVNSQPVNTFVSESDTLRALMTLGITNESEQINCNGCGFITCRRFAKALSRGEVRRDMCTHFVQSELRLKFSTLLSKLTAGVAVVSRSGKVIEANRLFATMMGPRAEMAYDASPGLAGTKAEDLVPFFQIVESVLEGEQDSVVRDVQVRERLLTVSVHSIQRYGMVLVICRNMLFSQVRNEEIVARTQKVISENLETVQKIAYLLGENASRTEAMLNSILESHTADDEH